MHYWVIKYWIQFWNLDLEIQELVWLQTLKKSSKDKLPNLQQYCGMCQIDTVNEIDLRHIEFFFPLDFELNQRIPCGILFWMESTYVLYYYDRKKEKRFENVILH